MRVTLNDPSVNVQDILAFVEKAYWDGNEAAVSIQSVPLLVRTGFRPTRNGVYIFPLPRFKRIAHTPVYERAAALLLLVLLSPLLLLVSLLVLCDGGLPIFYSQRRSGRNNRPFTIWKFRTMVNASGNMQEELLRTSSRSDRLFKMADDPRVTRIGAVLRKTFIDELPQLVNIINGEMRFFGPRPLPAFEHGHYQRRNQSLRLISIPGLSGVWQVSGRNRHTFDEMCLLDYYGICHSSFGFNTLLFFRTLKVAFAAKGY
ncbi:MAG: sugar transferase [Kiritimatiellae bacterium]|nr:sugar transferase [Kiritimatiellia bacterium]